MQTSDYGIADKSFGKMFGLVKVNFHQHNQQQVIRAVARKNGVTKTRIFTPDIATAAGITYDLRSAIDWVKTVGFKDVSPSL